MNCTVADVVVHVTAACTPDSTFCIVKYIYKMSTEYIKIRNAIQSMQHIECNINVK